MNKHIKIYTLILLIGVIFFCGCKESMFGMSTTVQKDSSGYSFDATSSFPNVIVNQIYHNGHRVFWADEKLYSVFAGADAGGTTITTSSGESYGLANNAFGNLSQISITTGYWNNTVGNATLYSNTTGAGNNVIGDSAMYYNESGSFNNASGDSALVMNTTGNYNSAFGQFALASNNGSQNVAIGSRSGFGDFDLPDWVDNMASYIDNSSTFIGFASGRAPTVPTSTALINATAIGYNAKVGASNSLILGGTGSYAVKVGIGTTTPATPLDVNGTTTIRLGGKANRAMCWKSDGVTLGYCSTIIGADGSCTCL